MSKSIDENFAVLVVLISETNKRWAEEVNSNGTFFDYDSQDIYREHLVICNSLNYKEQHKSTPNSEFRDLVTIEFPKLLLTSIQIYEQHKVLFDNLDRNKLQLNQYRDSKKSSMSDNELKVEILGFTELMNRTEYYNSDFYKDFGFLNINYHEAIYLFNKKILKDLSNDFKDYDFFKKANQFKYESKLFNMEFLGKIHSYCNKKVFDDCDELDFYNEFNFLNSFNKIQISKNNRKQFYYLIFKISLLVEKKIRKEWIQDILKNFNLEYIMYKNKVSQLKKETEINSNSTSVESLAQYKKEIDSLFIFADSENSHN